MKFTYYGASFYSILYISLLFSPLFWLNCLHQNIVLKFFNQYSELSALNVPDCGLLGYGIVKSCKRTPTFRRSLLHPFLSWKKGRQESGCFK
jgi:hypothetical protein